MASMRSGIDLLYHPDCGWWLANAAMQGVSKSARVLMKKGLIEIDKGSMRPSGGCVFRLTEKGKKP